MANKFHLLRCFKKTNFFFFGLQPCITLLMIVCTLVLLYRTTVYSKLTYQEVNPNISFPINHGSNNKEYKFGNKANQIVERSGHANKNPSFSQSNNKWHKTLQLPDKSSSNKKTDITSVQEDMQWQQALCTKATNSTDIGINTTHICGVLMEPVNVNYSINIYFTIKTTHKFYTNRLLLLMLTWLQTVDKNKVCKL